MNAQPVVSVCMITYGHEKFIRQAIEGILMQECDFKIELIVANDGSPDSTNEIVQEILENHPKASWIKYIYHEKNIGMMNNFIFALKECKSKYIAICEGDDYWTDSLKLQKQVDFLESNPEYVISCHDTFVIDENGMKIKDSILSDFHKKDFSGEQLMNGAFVMPLTMCFRNVVKEFPKEFSLVKNGDTFLISLLGQSGMSKFQPEIKPSAYREHGGGVWSKATDENKEHSRNNTYFQLFLYYRKTKGYQNVAKSYYVKFSYSFSKLIQMKLENQEYIKSLRLYLSYFMKCFRYGHLHHLIDVTKSYLVLIKKLV